MRFQSVLAATAGFVASVSAHATFQELWINNVDAGSSCARLPTSNNPVTSVTSSTLACNIFTASSGVCPVNAGDSLTVEMHQQPNDRSCANQAIGGDHYGPINVYMAKVADATTADPNAAGWFKVSEMGLLSSNPDYWATEVLNDNCGHYTFKVPTDIAPGNYLVRAEVIALHVASSVGGAQFYPGCFQINVSGSGSATPATVEFPGAYGAEDPGILINIYTQLNSYVIPGPTVYEQASPAVATTAYPTTATWNTALQPSTVPTVVPGGGSGSTAQSGTTTPPNTKTATTPTTTPTSRPTTTTPTTVKPTSTSTPPPTTSGAALYGQCGGQGWTGPTTCASGTCTFSNQYYSQCLP